MTSSSWHHPLIKKGAISPIGSEVTPFVFRNRLHRIENFKRCEDFPGQPATYRFHEDGFRIRDVESDRVISVPLLNHYFATAFVWQDRVHVFCGDYGNDRPWWTIQKMVTISSDDLITWTKPTIVLQAENDENIFNNGICWDGRRFVMLYETDDARWQPKFTFKYCESTDLLNWRCIPGAIYGRDKYVGGPALYFEAGWYYTVYLHDLFGSWESRITRSRDLLTWQDAPADRPFVAPDRSYQTNPTDFPSTYEINASDVDLCEWQGKTVVYWNGGDQQTCGDLQWGEFNGSRREFLESFFA